jgi:hypothetical protein
MLQQEQSIGNGPGLALLDQRALQRQRVVVWHDAQSAYRKLTRLGIGSSSLVRFFVAGHQHA